MAHGRDRDPRGARRRQSRGDQSSPTRIDRLAAALRRQDELRRATIDDVVHELRGVARRRRRPARGAAGRAWSPTRRRAGADEAPRASACNRLVDDVAASPRRSIPGCSCASGRSTSAPSRARAAAGYAERCRARGITLTHRIATARVDGDPERLAQILDNLLSNALRYTDAGGRVAVGLSVRDGEAVLQVADTGIGIAPEHLPRIFDRFWRDAAGARARGRGLGRRARARRGPRRRPRRARGGRQRARRGSRFSVFLPLSHEPVAAPDVRDPATERCATRRRPLREPADPRISIEPSSPRAGLLHLGP